jgi:predicted ArsR family transcriptional regulator
MNQTTDMSDKTRMQIIHLLKQHGKLSATALGKLLDRTPMAIRLQLHALHGDGFVANTTSPAGRGRPTILWSLTPAADEFFPDEHKRLAVDLIGYIKDQFGDDGLRRVIDRFSRDQLIAYSRRIDRKASLDERVQALAQLRTEEGYMADVTIDGDSLLLAENHCPVCDVARSCTRLCSNEIDVFRSALGPDAEVIREDHIISGARRCLYRIRERSTR